jgi:hypothetical protein
MKGRGWRILGGLLLTVAIAAMAGAAIYFAHEDHTNRSSAKRWRARSVALRHLLDARTTELSQRTHALKVAGRQLGSLGGQVGTLDQRTRALAAEKAHVEDERVFLQTRAQALQTVAQNETNCSDGLSQAIPHIAAGDAAWLRSNGAQIDATCQRAQKSLQAFNAKYG